MIFYTLYKKLYQRSVLPLFNRKKGNLHKNIHRKRKKERTQKKERVERKKEREKERKKEKKEKKELKRKKEKKGVLYLILTAIEIE